jgi:hypothetical protein
LDGFYNETTKKCNIGTKKNFTFIQIKRTNNENDISRKEALNCFVALVERKFIKDLQIYLFK